MRSDIVRIADKTIKPAKDKETVINSDGQTRDIVKEILAIDKLSQIYTRQFAKHLKGKTLRGTCFNIWEFVKYQIEYVLDPEGIQFTKTPGKTWKDRFADCKAYSIFISSCLKNLGINHAYRFVSYSNISKFTHVYIVVKEPQRIVIDSVMPGFDREKPFNFHKDVNMTKIIRLEGIGQEDNEITDPDDFLFTETELKEEESLTQISDIGRRRRRRTRRRPLQKLKRRIFKRFRKTKAGIKKLFRTGTAATSRVLERVAIKRSKLKVPIKPKRLKVRDKDGRTVTITLRLDQISGNGGTLPGELNIGDPADLTEGKFDLLIAKQRLEIEKQLVEEMSGIGALKAERFQDSIDTIDEALEALEISDPEEREIELELITEDALAGLFSIADGLMGIGDIGRRKRKRKAKKAARKLKRSRRKAIKLRFKGVKGGRKKARKEISAKGLKTKTGRFLQKAGKAAKKVLKAVTKVITAPARLIIKGILEVSLPAASPFFLYLFINDTKIIATLPKKVRRKRKKAEKIADFIVKRIGMKRKHFMGIVRNGIMKKFRMSPEKVIERAMKGKLSGVGAFPAIVIGGLIKIIKKIGKVFKKLFGKKDLPTQDDAPNPEEDFGELTAEEQAEIAKKIKEQEETEEMERGGFNIFNTLRFGGGRTTE